MSFAAGDDVVAAEHVHNFVKRTGTNTTVSGGWTAIPFATLAQGTMVGVSTSDNITYTLQPGLWFVTVSLYANTGTTDITGALFEGSNVDPYNGSNTELYAHSTNQTVGSTAGVSLATQIFVPAAATRTVRCSAFAASGTLRSAAPGPPRLTFSWRF